MKSQKILLALFFVLFSSSCTVYTEKQSESLSRAVYATEDSFEKARVDLASIYASEAARIVKPPKNKIKIYSIYKNANTAATVSSTGSKAVVDIGKRRVLIIPEEYKNDAVVVVNSQEYKKLLEDKEAFERLKKDHEQTLQFKDEVDKELARQESYSNKMIQDLNRMQKQLLEKDLAILRKNIIIVLLLAAMGGAAYLRIKGVL